MAKNVANELREILEEYRGRMKTGGHPKELPDRILILARDFPDARQMPDDLEPLYTAARQFWNTYDQMPEGEREPDPLDLEMVCDEVIDALYDFYGLR